MKVSVIDVTIPRVALRCVPFFGAPFTVHVVWTGSRWSLLSGRRPTDKMLDAIDRCPEITLRAVK